MRFIVSLFFLLPLLSFAQPCGTGSIYGTIPANPTPGSPFSIVTEAWFCTMGCEGFNESIIWIGPNHVELSTYHCPGMLQALCQDFDTFAVGNLPAGNYIVTYRAYSSGDCMAFTESQSYTDTITVGCTSALSSAFQFTANGLSVSFIDQSAGNPTTWSWDFGDGNTSSAPSPTHTYAQDGNYTVCLIVQDSCKTDTLCQNLSVLGIENGTFQTLQAFPTPTHDILNLQFNTSFTQPTHIEIYAMDGSLKALIPLPAALPNGFEVDFSSYPDGIYWLRAVSPQHFESVRVMVQH